MKEHSTLELETTLPITRTVEVDGEEQVDVVFSRDGDIVLQFDITGKVRGRASTP